MRRFFKPVLLSAVLALAGAPLLQAAASQAIQIDSASANISTHLLTINGANFGTQPPTVIVDGVVLSIFSYGPSQVMAVLPPGVEGVAGDYAMTITRNAGNQSASASFKGRAPEKPAWMASASHSAQRKASEMPWARIGSL